MLLQRALSAGTVHGNPGDDQRLDLEGKSVQPKPVAPFIGRKLPYLHFGKAIVYLPA